VQVKFDGVHMTIEDSAIPNMFAALVSTLLGVLDNFAKREAFRAKMLFSWTFKALSDLRDFFPLLPDTYDPTSFQTEAEMVSNIFFFNVMAQDEANGVFRLDHNRLDLDWPQPVAQQPVFAKIETLLKAFTEEMRGPDGRYVAFPLWQGLANRKLVITHPLGGCPIGGTSADGVVDALGRVFDGSKPPGAMDVLPGLYVVDASVIPGALAANPTLTIAAQALKTVAAALP
jgi:choline dehydrogenase-like flavoprotein